MNVAVCLSGLIRYPDNALKTIRKIIPKENIKIFIHTWKIKDKENFSTKVFQPEYKEINKIVEDGIEFLDNYEYETILVENYDSYELKFQKIYDYLSLKYHGFNTTLSPISMYYSVFKSNELKCNYEKSNNMIFDWVIRMRMDSDLIDNDLDLNNYNCDLNIPFGEDWESGLNDQFAIGRSHIMDIYSNVYHNITNIDIEKYQPETILKKHLESYNITPNRVRLRVRINNGKYSKHVLYPDWVF